MKSRVFENPPRWSKTSSKVEAVYLVGIFRTMKEVGDAPQHEDPVGEAAVVVGESSPNGIHFFFQQ
jgi:hypothetical protein